MGQRGLRGQMEEMETRYEFKHNIETSVNL